MMSSHLTDHSNHQLKWIPFLLEVQQLVTQYLMKQSSMLLRQYKTYTVCKLDTMLVILCETVLYLVLCLLPQQKMLC